MHLKLTVATALVAIPLSLAAQSGPPRPLGVVQLEGAVARQAAPAAQAPAQPGPLAPLPVTQLDDRQSNPALDEVISLTFSSGEPVPVTRIFGLIADQTGLSVVVDPTVMQTFQGDLRNVTIRQALDLITEQAGLDYTVQGNIIKVFPRELETRLWNIDYVLTQRGGTRSMSASSAASGGNGLSGGAGVGTGASATAGVGGAGGSTGSGGGAGASASVGGTDAPDFWGGLLEGVRALAGTDSTINLDRTAGLLQVTAQPRSLDRIDQYIQRVMLRVTRQVHIEARVVSVDLNEQSQAGINWTKVFSSISNSLSISQNVAPGGGTFTLAGNFGDNFSALFSAFARQGNTNLVSSPSVTTMNNQPAIMNAGSNEVFFSTTTQRDANGVITQAATTPQTISVGVVLSVTPQISADGIITMSMNPSLTELQDKVSSPAGGTVPVIAQRTTDTVVRVRDGDTIVIAGLMQDKWQVTTTKVPVLGDLPMFGGFFRSKDKTKTKSDLVIMLTPTITGPVQVPAHTAETLRQLDVAQRSKH